MNSLQNAIEVWLGYPVEWSDTASWVQAIGSILAIGASSFFAIWVPLRMRDLAGRDEVQRAINNSIILCGICQSAWTTFLSILQEKAWGPRSAEIIRQHVATGRTVAAQVPHSMMLGEAYYAVTSCTSSIHNLEIALDTLAGNEALGDRAEVAFGDAVEDLKKVEGMLRVMEPKKVAGHWMMLSPQDELPKGAKVAD
jgi:hypothetical protein